MVCAHQLGEFGALLRHAPALVDLADGGDAARIVSDVFGQNVSGGEGFADIVQQRGVAFGQG